MASLSEVSLNAASEVKIRNSSWLNLNSFYSSSFYQFPVEPEISYDKLISETHGPSYEALKINFFI